MMKQIASWRFTIYSSADPASTCWKVSAILDVKPSLNSKCCSAPKEQRKKREEQ
jgi:hypothetical protein